MEVPEEKRRGSACEGLVIMESEFQFEKQWDRNEFRFQEFARPFFSWSGNRSETCKTFGREEAEEAD